MRRNRHAKEPKLPGEGPEGPIRGPTQSTDDGRLPEPHRADAHLLKVRMAVEICYCVVLLLHMVVVAAA